MKYMFVPLVISAMLSAQAPPPAKPTVAEARAFVDRVNAELSTSGIEASRAGWIAATYINDDAEALTAIVGSRRIAQTNQFIAESHRFDSIELPSDLLRQISLLRTNARPAPSDPALRLENPLTGAAHCRGKESCCNWSSGRRS